MINGQDKTTDGYTYDGSTLSIIIYIRQPLATAQSIQIQVQLSDSITDALLVQTPIPFVGLLGRCQSAKALLDNQGGARSVYMDDYPVLLDTATTGLRITHSPSTAKDEIKAFFNQRVPGACDEVAHNITNLDRKVRSFILAQLQCSTFLRMSFQSIELSFESG